MGCVQKYTILLHHAGHHGQQDSYLQAMLKDALNRSVGCLGSSVMSLGWLVNLRLLQRSQDDIPDLQSTVITSHGRSQEATGHLRRIRCKEVLPVLACAASGLAVLRQCLPA